MTRSHGAVFVFLFFVAADARAATLEVGAGKMYAKPCDAVAAAKPNDTIEVQPGTYTDTCAIAVAGLTIRGVGGRPKIDLTGMKPANDKGIYVIDADNVTLENLELTGAAIACGLGANAAGIRHQASALTVTRCYIHDNQNGILGGGAITVQYTELARNGLGPGCNCGGCTHNLYVGQSGGKVTFRFNYSHSIATDGHLLKSRADEVDISYNRFSTEQGHDSFNIDLPNGGLATIVGNVVQKGASAGNFILLNWGEEGITKTDKRVFVVNNTFVNDANKGTFINANGSTLVAHNNVFFGPGTVSSTGMLSADNLSGVDPLLVDRMTLDYHLKPGSPAIDKGVDPGMGASGSLYPTFQYVHPADREGRSIVGSAADIGAFEFGNVPPNGDGGADASSPSDASVGNDGSNGGDGLPESGVNGPTDKGGGCGCHTGSAPSTTVPAWLLLGAFAALRAASSRRGRPTSQGKSVTSRTLRSASRAPTSLACRPARTPSRGRRPWRR